MTKVVAKPLGVFFSFFYFFFVNTFFNCFFKTRGYPLNSTRTQNYRYKKSSTENVPGNIVSAKNKKEEKNYNIKSYLNISKYRGGEEKI